MVLHNNYPNYLSFGQYLDIYHSKIHLHNKFRMPINLCRSLLYYCFNKSRDKCLSFSIIQVINYRIWSYNIKTQRALYFLVSLLKLLKYDLFLVFLVAIVLFKLMNLTNHENYLLFLFFPFIFIDY